MKGLVIAVIVLVAVIAAFAFGLVDIDQTRETRLPEVAVQGGQAPAFDVDTAKVAVGTRKEQIKVPEVDVDTKNESIDVPVVDVDKAR